MAWTFLNAPSTSSTQGRRDAVRLMINDLSSGRPLRTDESIKFALDQEGNSLYRAAAWLCDGLADSEAVTARVGDLTLGGEKPTNYRALAHSYRYQDAIRAAVPYMAAQSISEKITNEQDTNRVLPIFSRNMMKPVDLAVGSTSPTT